MRCLLVLASLPLFLGCGSSTPPPEGGPPPSTYLTDVKLLLEQFEKDRKRPPARPSEIAEYEPSFPGAVRKLNGGDVVYAWGNPLGSGKGILAYGRNAASEGGPVLFEDGTVREITAEEFASAPKLSKK
jgi:hypothetical protein